RAVDGVVGQKLEHRLEKALELGLAHLAAAHCEVGVADPAEPTNMAVDRNVVGRIREYELRLGVIQQPNICSRISRIRAEEAVRSKFPQIARTGYGRTGFIDWCLVFATAWPTSR